MCCGLLAESSLLGRDDVLEGLVQLAGHMLTACTAAHRSLSAWVASAASATAANATAQAALVVDSTPCDVIDLTADDDDDDDKPGASNQHAADTEAAGRQGLSHHPPVVQCKTESSQQGTLPEQDTQNQQGMLSQQAESWAQQAGKLPQPTSGLPNQAVMPEPVRAGSASQAEAASTSGEGLAPLPLGEGMMEDLCMLCAYGMDLAALLGCLLNQVDTWSGTARCFWEKVMQLQSQV